LEFTSKRRSERKEKFEQGKKNKKKGPSPQEALKEAEKYKTMVSSSLTALII